MGLKRKLTWSLLMLDALCQKLGKKLLLGDRTALKAPEAELPARAIVPALAA